MADKPTLMEPDERRGNNLGEKSLETSAAALVRAGAAQTISPTGWYRSGIYYDPNVLGPAGYQRVGGLLLFFERVFLYAPLGAQVEWAAEKARSALSLGDFQRFVVDGLIVPVGYETFWDPEVRERLYPVGYHPSTPFDRELLDPSSIAGSRAIRMPNFFKHDIAPALVKGFLESPRGRNSTREIAGYVEVRGDTAFQGSPRYLDVWRGRFPMPQDLSETLRSTPTPEERLLAFVARDVANDRFAMGTSGARIQYTDSTLAWLLRKALAVPYQNPIEEKSSQADRLVGCLSHAEAQGMIVAAIEQVLCKRRSRLTYEHVMEFRTKHRDAFIADLEGLLHRASSIEDPLRRGEAFAQEVAGILEDASFHFELGLKNLTNLLLGPAGHAFLGEPLANVVQGAPNSRARKFMNILRKPILGRKWPFFFFE